MAPYAARQSELSIRYFLHIPYTVAAGYVHVNGARLIIAQCRKGVDPPLDTLRNANPLQSNLQCLPSPSFRLAPLSRPA